MAGPDGTSNKTFVGEMPDVELEDRLAGTLAATIAARDGTAVFRAHQVRPDARCCGSAATSPTSC
ncbi:hypothetical protein ACWGJV_16840 [Streptomyces tendae]